MFFEGYDAFVRVDGLFEIHGPVADEREGRISVEILIQCDCLFGADGTAGMDAGEDSSGEIASYGDELEFTAETGLDPVDVSADFQQVLVLENFIGGEIVVPPAEVGGGSGFDSRSGGTGYSCDIDVALKQTFLGQGEYGQLYGGGEASGVGDFRGPGYSFPLHFRQSIYISFRFVAEILCEVDDFQPCRAVVALPEFPAFSVSGAEEKNIDAVEVIAVRELDVGVTDKPFVDIIDVVPCIAFGMYEFYFYIRVIYQNAQQFTGGITSPAYDSGFNHREVRLCVKGSKPAGEWKLP